MKLGWGALSLLFAAIPAAAAVSADLSSQVALRSFYQSGSQPLTTERIWVLDPKELNPHRQRWVLSRQVELADVSIVELRNDRFGVGGVSVVAKAESFIRAPGPWYSAPGDFPCEKEPAGWFATEQGSRAAAASAREVWERILSRGRVRLALALRKVSGNSSARIRHEAEIVFEKWVNELDFDWRTGGRAEIRKLEWESYWKSARDLGYCEKKKSVGAPAWETMMEAAPGIHPGSEPPKFLTRAPARRWDGSFSVRLSMNIGKRVLNGQFLIDSTARTSVLNENWLQNQGVPSDWIEDPDARPRKAVWSGGGSVGTPAQVDRVELSGYAISLRDFLVGETDLYESPETVASCCDGILGQDFLRQYVIEFRPGSPAEILIWPREGFSRNLPWIEASLIPAKDKTSALVGALDGAPISACSLRLQDGQKAGALFGVRWDTGFEGAFEIHRPWGKSEALKWNRPWGFQCGPESIATGISRSLLAIPGHGEEAFRQETVPAFTAGMSVLGRGPFILDLPHGRIWFSKGALSASIRQNSSGVRAKYVLRDGDRELKIVGLQKGTAADSLIQAGLKPGMLISRMDNKDAAEMDAWEVAQRLEGQFGDTVSLSWKAGAGKNAALKTAVIRIR